MVNPADSPSEVVQAEVGMQDGDGETIVPVSGLETIYVGSQICPGCGCLMTPVQVLWGTGLCPSCQTRKHDEHIRGRMA